MISRQKTVNFLRLRVRPWDLLVACGAIASAVSVFAFFGRFWWFLDLFTHFRVQYFLGLSLIALVLSLRRQFKIAAFFGIIAVTNLGTVAPLYFGSGPPHDNPSRRYRVLLMNVNTESGKPALVDRAIRQLDPDLIVLEEINEEWLSKLSGVLVPYRYSEVMPREDNFGIGLFSRHSLVRSEIRQVGEAEIPSVIAQVELPDGQLTVIGTHALPPGGADNSRLRNEQLARLAEMVKQAGSPVLLLGDLNTTPWSFHFRQLLRRSGLRDSAQGRRVQGTWPAFLPLLLIPIDHCLYTGDVHITGRFKGPKVGSDHYPLVVDFVLAPHG